MDIKKISFSTVLFVVIVIVAVFLRLYNIDYMEFKGDESLNSLKAQEFAEGGVFPLTSARGSTGLNEPPIFMYLLSIPFFFTSNPVAAASFIAVLNVLGLVLCYLFVKRFYSVKAALIAAALYAVSPWQVLFSRKIWTQDLLAPFVIIFLYFIFSAIYEKKEKYLVFALVSLGFLVQLHLSAAYFMIVAIIVIIGYWKRIDKKYLGIGSILFLVTFTPYLVFQVNNDLVDVRTAISLTGEDSSFHVEPFILPFKLVSTNGFGFLFGPDFPYFKEKVINIQFFDLLFMVLLFFSIIYSFSKKRNHILILCLIFGTAYLAFSKINNIDTHYFLSFLPIYFILMGCFIERVINRCSNILKYLVCSLVFVLVLYQLIFSIQFLNFIDDRDCFNGEYGPPYAYRVDQVLGVAGQAEGLDIEKIHELSCACKKCDFLATKFIIENSYNKITHSSSKCCIVS